MRLTHRQQQACLHKIVLGKASVWGVVQRPGLAVWQAELPYIWTLPDSAACYLTDMSVGNASPGMSRRACL